MRRYFSLLVCMLFLVSLAGCGTYTVESEPEAQRVYTCSSRNIVGLEKIAVFDDKVIFVFDKKKGLDGRLAINMGNESMPYVGLDNVTMNSCMGSNIEETEEKYIFNGFYTYTTEHVVDLKRHPEPNSVFYDNGEGRTLEIKFNDSSISIYVTNRKDGGHDDYYQDYDIASKTWSAERAESIIY